MSGWFALAGLCNELLAIDDAELRMISSSSPRKKAVAEAGETQARPGPFP
jgi:hypothetical protein